MNDEILLSENKETKTIINYKNSYITRSSIHKIILNRITKKLKINKIGNLND